jgi:hypothetical protein
VVARVTVTEPVVRERDKDGDGDGAEFWARETTAARRRRRRGRRIAARWRGGEDEVEHG